MTRTIEVASCKDCPARDDYYAYPKCNLADGRDIVTDDGGSLDPNWCPLRAGVVELRLKR